MTQPVVRKILLLEDDGNLGFILNEHLVLGGFEVRLCTNGQEGETAVGEGRFDLYLVDVMMPKKDGFTFAREVRARGDNTPIIFLTAKSLKEDRIEGFRIGGDDYVTKPFSMEELTLRIHAVLKRSVVPVETGSQPVHFTIGRYSFDAVRQTLAIDGRTRTLTPRENDLLRLLCLHVNRTLSRENALRTLWGNDTYFNGRSMDVFVSRLRKYLAEDPDVQVMGVHGQGIRLIAPQTGAQR